MPNNNKTTNIWIWRNFAKGLSKRKMRRKQTNQNGWFFARFATMIFAITCISNLIARKFDDKDAYLLILELAVKLVWSRGSCDHMNSSSPIIVHFPSIVFLISSIFKNRVSSSKTWIKVVFGHPLCSGHKTSFFPLCVWRSPQALYLLNRLDFLRIFLYATLLVLFVFSCLW